MSYNLSLLLGIKLYQLPISSIEIENVVESNNKEEQENNVVHIIKLPQYEDYKSTPIYYHASHLGSNFFVQAIIEDKDEVKEILINQNIFMDIINSFLPSLLLLIQEEIIRMIVSHLH
jgi:hypothetical protein